YVHVAGDDPEIVELKPGHHIGLEFHESGKVKKIIVNNKSKHPDARIIEVAYADLDHALRIDGYDVGEEDVKLSFDVDRQAVFVMDEEETQSHHTTVNLLPKAQENELCNCLLAL